MQLLKLTVGTFFGSGLLPKAPGTWGSLAALPFISLAYWVHPAYGITGFLILSSIASLWATDTCVEKFGDDPGEFVIDEVAGQSVVFLMTGFTLHPASDIFILLIGFLLFRLFDITKPLGIKRLEQLPGKFGILLDDLAAGLYALICLELLKMVFKAHLI